ncbi:MAG TPA: hypothetical protein VE981_14350 [Planctomycetota bacterium]|nr:hypothetical protein [Planctomycetota bacterium]
MTLLLAAILLQDPVPTDKEGEAAAHRLREEAGRSSIEGKIAALQEALKTEHEKVIKVVAEMMLTEADSVRIAGAAALAQVDHPASAEALAAAIAPNLHREEVMAAIFKAIGELGWQSPAGRINELVPKVGEVDVRAVLPDAVKALGMLGSLSSVDPLIDLLMKLENGGRRNPWPNEGALRRSSEDALRNITGMDFHKVAEWESWWRGNQELVRTRLTRTFWIRKTQDRVDIAPIEKVPADSLLVASRMHTAAAPGAAPGKKKKKKS